VRIGACARTSRTGWSTDTTSG